VAPLRRTEHMVGGGLTPRLFAMHDGFTHDSEALGSQLHGKPDSLVEVVRSRLLFLSYIPFPWEIHPPRTPPWSSGEKAGRCTSLSGHAVRISKTKH
jgi:hypothetical protein